MSQVQAVPPPALAAAADAPLVVGGITLASRLIVTEIAADFECDAFFPVIEPSAWQEVSRETHHSDSLGVDYAFVIYQRR